MNEKELNKKRLKANKELVKILSTIVKENPNQRFSQILRNYGFIKENIQDQTRWEDEFYAEPDIILDRVKANYSKAKEQKD